jgi:hypothetical protein
MRFLSTTNHRFTTITIAERQDAPFVVPIELAALITWFLVSSRARLAALVAWSLAMDVAGQYYRFCDYLAGWRNDLIIIKLAILDLFGVPVEFAGA